MTGDDLVHEAFRTQTLPVMAWSQKRHGSLMTRAGPPDNFTLCRSSRRKSSRQDW